MTRFTFLALGAALLFVSTPCLADDLTGAERLLCATRAVMACWTDGECDSVSPTDVRVPQFVEIDLKHKKMATTKASGENRATDIVNLQRDAGKLVLQGYQNGRAFSLVIEEKTGQASAAVALSDLSVALFAACTPLPPPA